MAALMMCLQLRLHDFVNTLQKKSSDLQRNVDQLNQHIRDKEKDLASSEEVGVS